MKVAFLDVGQGDSVLITAPNGNRLLYDSGPPDKKVLSSLESELGTFDRKINIFVASHPDSDHIGGFPDLLQKFTPDYYLDGHTINLSTLFTTLENDILTKNIKRFTAQRNTKIDIGSGVVGYIISPVQDARKDSLTSNDSSVVLLIKYGKTSILLTGDLEEKEEQFLAKTYGSNLKATILKVGHHGSKSSTSNSFLNSVNPEYSIISAGKKNKYGHPHLSTINRLMLASTTIFETSKLGTVRFSCDLMRCQNTNI